jgi:hypothetical protein
MEENRDITPPDQHIGIFDENPDSILDQFGINCERVGINTAIAICKDPDTGKPMVFIRGHLYDVGVLTTQVLSEIRKELVNNLSLLIIIICYLIA